MPMYRNASVNHEGKLFLILSENTDLQASHVIRTAHIVLIIDMIITFFIRITTKLSCRKPREARVTVSCSDWLDRLSK